LFTIPRDLVLSTQTSDLPLQFGPHKWKEFQLDEGWAGLILCMMWEEASGSQSRWDGYLSLSRIFFTLHFPMLTMATFTIESLPTEFDTPIFWNEADLEELNGSFVLGVFSHRSSSPLSLFLNNTHL
jgi:SET domain-containing protein 6